MDKDEKIRLLEEENDALKNEVTTLKLQLDKYLLKNKNYYESHKEEHKKRVSDYQQRTKYITNIDTALIVRKGINEILYLFNKDKNIQIDLNNHKIRQIGAKNKLLNNGLNLWTFNIGKDF